jgi:hypothetical protein
VNTTAKEFKRVDVTKGLSWLTYGKKKEPRNFKPGILKAGRI